MGPALLGAVLLANGVGTLQPAAAVPAWLNLVLTTADETQALQRGGGWLSRRCRSLRRVELVSSAQCDGPMLVAPNRTTGRSRWQSRPSGDSG